MKKIALFVVTFFLVITWLSGCRTPEEWKKIDTVLENNPERGKYFAIWDDKIQVKTDTWEALMKQIDEKCPKKTTPFIYYRPPKRFWDD